MQNIVSSMELAFFMNLLKKGQKRWCCSDVEAIVYEIKDHNNWISALISSNFNKLHQYFC